jgi:glycosyltransferase involved in cell wall biosynthesis
MKGIYLSICDLENKSSGVSKKINMQLEIFQLNNIFMEAPDFTNKLFSERVLNKILGVLPFTSNLFSLKVKRKLANIDWGSINVIYIRKALFDKTFLNILKEIKMNNPSIKVLLEVPTYPSDNEYKSFAQKLKLYKEKRVRKYFSKYIDRILTFSDDNQIYGIETIKISNAIDKQKITPRKKIVDDGRIHIIAVALFTFWHGYDRFLEGMKEYYSNSVEKKDIILHFVGNGNELNHYRNLVNNYSLNAYVKFHGEKHGADLDEVYNLCDIALDSMGRHRGNVYYNSTLKGKEYGAKGLPIISGVKTELDSDPQYKYYMRVSADDTPIDISRIVDFYNIIYKNESPEEIVSKVREYTINRFDIANAWSPVIDYIKK